VSVAPQALFTPHRKLDGMEKLLYVHAPARQRARQAALVRHREAMAPMWVVLTVLPNYGEVEGFITAVGTQAGPNRFLWARKMGLRA